MIRPATPSDADAVCRIYNRYVLETIISFEEAPVATAEMAERIEDLCRTHPWYVYEESGAAVGYAYAGPWRTRAAYRDAVESTVYVESSLIGRGIGSKLYDALIPELRRRSFHCTIGGIALPNAARWDGNSSNGSMSGTGSSCCDDLPAHAMPAFVPLRAALHAARATPWFAPSWLTSSFACLR